MRTTAIMLALLLLAFIQNLHAGDSSGKVSQMVDINAATAAQLADGLPGIGPAKAALIIKWRDNNGMFTHVEQLQQVKGIGPKTVEKLRKYVRMGSAADAKRSQLEQGAQEEHTRAAIRRVMLSAKLAAQPESRQQLPVRPWYRRSALEILRSH